MNHSLLPCAAGATFNSRLWEHEPQCLPETRTHLLQKIMIWSKDPNGECIFWLNGMAGTGKSTIARTIARILADQNRLGASFFFSRGRGDLGHAGMFFTSVAIQLVNVLPALSANVGKAIVENHNITQQGLGDQWKYLIFKPLSDLRDTAYQSQIITIVIDAFDECEGDDDVRLILQLLSEAKSLRNIKLRFFLTSRPETPIRLGFDRIPEAAHQDFVLHNISPSVVLNDILVFLSHNLESIREEYKIHRGWPDEQSIKILAEGASGLFIYAATACRFIRSPKFPPEDRLLLLLKGSTARPSPTQKLDEIYTQVLTHSVVGACVDEEKWELAQQFRQVVGPAVVLFDALASVPLARLIDAPQGMVRAVLGTCAPFQMFQESQDRPIRLLHPSFRDFLLSHERCLDRQFWIDETTAHNNLLVNCLKLMSNHLRMDVCELRLSGALAGDVEKSEVEEHIPLDVQYACRYWAEHLKKSKIDLRDNNDVYVFLQKYFLYWLEALSMIGKMTDGINLVRELEIMLTVSAL